MSLVIIDRGNLGLWTLDPDGAAPTVSLSVGGITPTTAQVTLTFSVVSGFFLIMPDPSTGVSGLPVSVTAITSTSVIYNLTGLTPSTNYTLNVWLGETAIEVFSAFFNDPTDDTESFTTPAAAVSTIALRGGADSGSPSASATLSVETTTTPLPSWISGGAGTSSNPYIIVDPLDVTNRSILDIMRPGRGGVSPSDSLYGTFFRFTPPSGYAGQWTIILDTSPTSIDFDLAEADGSPSATTGSGDESYTQTLSVGVPYTFLVIRYNPVPVTTSSTSGVSMLRISLEEPVAVQQIQLRGSADSGSLTASGRLTVSSAPTVTIVLRGSADTGFPTATGRLSVESALPPHTGQLVIIDRSDSELWTLQSSGTIARIVLRGSADSGNPVASATLSITQAPTIDLEGSAASGSPTASGTLTVEEAVQTPGAVDSSSIVIEYAENNNRLIITWDEPSIGGAGIIDYNSQYHTGNGVWIDIETNSSNRLSVLLNPMAGGTVYSVRVRARNIFGHGPFSDVATFTHGEPLGTALQGSAESGSPTASATLSIVSVTPHVGQLVIIDRSDSQLWTLASSGILTRISLTGLAVTGDPLASATLSVISTGIIVLSGIAVSGTPTASGILTVGGPLPTPTGQLVIVDRTNNQLWTLSPGTIEQGILVGSASTDDPTASATLTVTQPIAGIGQARQRRKVLPNTLYSIGAYCKVISQSGTRFARLGIRYLDGSLVELSTLYSFALTNPIENWTLLEVSQQTPSNTAYVEILLESGGIGSIVARFDDVLMTTGATFPDRHDQIIAGGFVAR